MKRLRNHNNHGSVFRARRPLLPMVQPVTVDEGNGFTMVEIIIRYFRSRRHAGTVKTGEYVPREGSPNKNSRRRVCNYRRMQRRCIRNLSHSKIHRLFNL